MRWKRLPRFIDECQRQHRIFQGGITGGILSSRMRRLAMREGIYQDLVHLREERIKRARMDPKLAAEGGLTGLIVEKTQHDSRGNLIRTSYRIDHPTIRQMLSLMQEQAQDLGQWGTPEVNRPGRGPTAMRAGITDRALDIADLLN